MGGTEVGEEKRREEGNEGSSEEDKSVKEGGELHAPSYSPERTTRGSAGTRAGGREVIWGSSHARGTNS